jgi:hypothetical protein
VRAGVFYDDVGALAYSIGGQCSHRNTGMMEIFSATKEVNIWRQWENNIP